MVNNTIIVDDTMMSESTQNTSNTSLTTNSLRNIEEYLDTELMKTDNIKTELFKSLDITTARPGGNTERREKLFKG